VASGGTVENPGRIREIRRTIARLLTIEAQTQKQGASAK
jgi:ribosomal protein L29